MMKNTPGFFYRFGGIVLFLLVTAVLLWGWQSSQATAADGEPLAMATAVTPDGATETSSVGGTAVDIPILSDNSLAPIPVPHTFQGQQPQISYDTYLVQRGDTPTSIAEAYGISPETILGGNPRLSEESSLLQADTEIVILPVDGVLHDVRPGDTVESVAALYGASVEDIINYEPNNLEFPYRLYPDTQIIVPGGVRELFVWTPPDLTTVNRGTSGIGSGVNPVIVGTGTFIFPVVSRVFTQYYWYGHPGIDIALPIGSAVYASDSGTVTFAGWNTYGYGNLIVVNHGNGFETFYAHLSQIFVVPGQIVYQGDVIGGTGSTGNSSGPHIHFEIRQKNNRLDPCWYVGC
ncbi:MAG: peptidoglycan DD-metalloendopeptidase family protein [Anaerolineae bacterium]